ncbi:hypothetical protein [Synechococcus sp. A15-60]|uniref:hypothetical protein n=1 Tax=Synechococcus sp. A15-60 TaxID=1050655 RepID=UPI00164445A5|nr:hypothetical protein [Synechococcus sp. A15-60]
MKPQILSLPLAALIMAGCSSGVIATRDTDELVAKCKEEVRQQLKDPNSMVILSVGTKEGDEDYYKHMVEVQYTATNSYGGRIRNGRGCVFNSQREMTAAMNVHPDSDPKDFEDSNFIQYIPRS